MKRPTPKRIAFFLLFALAWSCFGFNIGMIGHGFLAENAHASHDTSMYTPGCCGTAETPQPAQDVGGDEHHSIVATIVEQIGVFIMIFFALIVFSLFTLKTVSSVSERIALYARRWGEQGTYFSFLFPRLFSEGILHAKIW
ncbi:MAG: hypothetical protein UV82_C0006G0042 [Candidatus Magasanikbacteria bacterium GW2011_GWD2_43_18]|uniref:Uncharacterized protein n=1 Tax=Candidatus Magasanikbacteria bacterium GW2011_GWE2_42_7 TaxID=1619052 RepID=A0A0G1DIH1_9BACT|nr:MAG: hypothetical protein UV18_C0005G0045 [Candidatus Magasanikbacteria bacterium GW2011_GWC2_42_27]KKS70601.1 MAG: hypothetical protein UV42_C0049G0003 [Candidatus Magasanikbacteria bacterium GW2011_GWE2_42_7]KKT04686.1 MAG: hypothetical protein UV82_C0006G0042 [Candidatus Magasanikbacteria bacterium GW2011_GWD2_43_18]KKT24541.1 MAG: hypothetical protein UW10_C0024G0010 [Candidatus Magasanikbacteria bacterium GW2011_GWA2_43_9]HBB37993.1 hypothetical protein [Candidatus Magasanikbacteria bac